MKKFLDDISWYAREFLTWLVEMIVIILGAICWLIYHGIIFFSDVIALYIVYKICVWLGL